MLNRIWIFLLCSGILGGIINGRIEEVGKAIFTAAGDAVTLSMGMLGIVALWCGLINIFDKSGGIAATCKMLRPLINRFLPSTKGNKEAETHVITNITANFFGLGNGATPSGIAAVKALERSAVKAGLSPEIASKDVCKFLIINTAAFQLLPTTVIALRASAGAANPADITIPTWIVSIVSLITGISVYMILSGIASLRQHKRSNI